MPTLGEKWFDNRLRLWSIVKVDATRIECVGANGAFEFFDAVTLETTSRFDKDVRLSYQFIDEFAPKPRKSNDQTT